MQPDCIIAGYGKCGTTSLYRYLSSHPGVCYSKKKETNVLIDDSLSYEEVFSGGGVAIDASPSYIHDLELVISKIRTEFVKKPVVILCTREPLSKVLSVYKAADRSGLLAGLDYNSFIERALSDLEVSSNDEWDAWLKNDVRNSIYINELDVLNRAGFMESVFFVDQSQLSSNPMAVLDDLCPLLGLDSDFYDEFDFSIENKGIEPRYKFLHRNLAKMNRVMEPLFNRYPDFKKELVRLYRKFLSSDIKGGEYSSEQLQEYIANNKSEIFNKLSCVKWLGGIPSWVRNYE